MTAIPQSMAALRPTSLEELLNQMCCPICYGHLTARSGPRLNPFVIVCGSCSQRYDLPAGIPNLFVRWEANRRNKHPFPQWLVTPEALMERAKRMGLKMTASLSPLKPREYLPIRWSRLFLALRLLLWVGLALSWRYPVLGWMAGLGFSIDFIALQVVLRKQYEREIQELIRYANAGRLHEKDIKDPLSDADEPDVHEVAMDRDEDVRSALKDTDLNDKTVLHIGCGGEHDADVAQVYAEKGAHQIGLDIYLPSLVAFRRLFQAGAVLAEALRLPFRSESVDFTNCTDIIEHVHDPYRFLQENFRVLKPGGRMLLITPNRCRLRRSWIIANPFGFPQSALGAWFPQLLPPRDMVAVHRDYVFFHTSFTPSELTTLLRSVGFHVKWVRVKAYRGPFKRARRLLERVPLLNTINDSLFALVEKPKDPPGHENSR